MRLVAAGATKPSEFALAKGEVVIGSAAGNDLVIHEASVSRRHAKIVRESAEFRVVDLQSTNGTFVNGRRITGSAVVLAGDELRFGAVRYTLRGGLPLSRSTNPRRRMRPASIAGVVALFFAAAFALTEYMVNWNRLERAIEHGGNAPTAPVAHSAITTAANPAAIVPNTAALAESPDHVGRPPPDAAASAELPPPSAADLAWLKPLNEYRSMAGLNPVAIDPALSAGDAAHARYLVKNYQDRIRAKGFVGVEGHEEDPASPWYAAEGAKAAAASDVMEGFHTDGKAWLTPAHAIDGWISIPFHRLWILNPNLHRAGYGQYCEGGMCAASLDILSGAGPMAGVALLTTPIEFPPDGSVIKIRSGGAEWPNPLSACPPGYRLPMGLPITLQLGALVDAHLSTYSLTRAGDASAAISACAFDASSYTNPDPQQQTRAREGMRDFGAVVVIPRDPLTPGRYTASITASGRHYTWSFTISG